MSRLKLTAAFVLFALSAPLQAQVFERPEPKVGFAYPDEYCTNRGVRVDVHGFACLRVDGGSFLAKCEISLNNPVWRATGESCEPDPNSESHSVLPN
ncbi:hypothetical protein CLV78_11538 [Aliiruegeria haliotis]|uniref:Uncharacterized protein n=1 Tax=Aliiruegeria haliotis TaxID=1280846 RepID=A0A2T0RG21_9RHOB|nr:hypothetical protein CLV78_11538 [Aliiruegeria haliotis]